MAKNLKIDHAEKHVKQNGWPRSPAVDGIKFLIMMTRPQNITVACQLLKVSGNVLQPGHHYQNFNSINSRRPWLPILISHLFQHGFLRLLATTFLHQGYFGLDFTSFLV